MKFSLAWLLLLGTLNAAAAEPCGQRCENHRQARESCADLPAAQQRRCLRDFTPASSCQRLRDASLCEALRAAQASCEGLSGQARRQCVAERLPRDASAPACRGRRCGNDAGLLDE